MSKKVYCKKCKHFSGTSVYKLRCEFFDDRHEVDSPITGIWVNIIRDPKGDNPRILNENYDCENYKRDWFGLNKFGFSIF